MEVIVDDDDDVGNANDAAINYGLTNDVNEQVYVRMPSIFRLLKCIFWLSSSKMFHTSSHIGFYYHDLYVVEYCR